MAKECFNKIKQKLHKGMVESKFLHMDVSLYETIHCKPRNFGGDIRSVTCYKTTFQKCK